MRPGWSSSVLFGPEENRFIPTVSVVYVIKNTAHCSELNPCSHSTSYPATAYPTTITNILPPFFFSTYDPTLMCLRSGVSKINREQQEIRCRGTEQETERSLSQWLCLKPATHSLLPTHCLGRPLHSTFVDMSSSVSGKKDTDGT